MIFPILAWLGGGYLCGWLVLPLVQRAFPTLPELAFGLSKTIGLLLIGWLMWSLVLIGMPFDPTWVRIVLSLLFLSAIGLNLRQRSFIPLRYEVLFAMAFLAFLGLRGFYPHILGGEKLSDAMVLSSLLNHSSLPPPDLWLSGHSVNYYYFGYFPLALLSKALATPLGQSYNLSLALLFALSVSGLQGLISQWMGAWWGILAFGFEFVCGNLVSGVRILQESHRWLQMPWDQASGAIIWDQLGMGATRIVTFQNAPKTVAAITEFPSFSFLFADLHPHLIAIPFSFIYLAVAYALVSGESVGPILWGMLALTLGAFGCLNSWELPVAFAVVAVACFVRQDAQRKKWQHVGCLMVSLLVGLFLFHPFFQHFDPPRGAKGIQLILDSPINAASWLLHFGLFAFLLVAWLSTRTRVVVSFLRVRWKPMIPLLLVFLWAAWHLLKQGGTLPWFTGLGIGLLLLLLLEERAPEQRFALLLFGIGLGITLGCNYLVVHDRTNTIFKLFMPTWTFFALASTFALREFCLYQPLRFTLIWSPFFAVLLGLSLIFPFLPGGCWLRGLQAWSGIDGERFLIQRDPDEAAALQWLRSQPPGDLLEAYGESWTECNRLAVFSGRSTWLGWLGHERLWHEGGEPLSQIQHRRARLDAAFKAKDQKALEEIVVEYPARYVIVRHLHGNLHAGLGTRFIEAFKSSSISIYARRD